ncbi:hypothetical protein E2C01_077934 [Portunus trituberculatus]|uniref:Uncharacterized protein n=1 Tax=Portunus trituberculatus TaxID=210409 RepID=A0A5B7IFP8_PORTR|nr:hypothetical protein [Portunus trituberculatus]
MCVTDETRWLKRRSAAPPAPPGGGRPPHHAPPKSLHSGSFSLPKRHLTAGSSSFSTGPLLGHATLVRGATACCRALGSPALLGWLRVGASPLFGSKDLVVYGP